MLYDFLLTVRHLSNEAIIDLLSNKGAMEEADLEETADEVQEAWEKAHTRLDQTSKFLLWRQNYDKRYKKDQRTT